MKDITIGLSEDAIQDAIQEVLDMKRRLDDTSYRITKRLTEEAERDVTDGFARAAVDSYLTNSGDSYYLMAKVPVTSEVVENKGTVSAHGDDAIWAEFGAGVYFNATNPYPNPPGRPAGISEIGEYGKGKGKQLTWAYHMPSGQLVFTHGVPASMPMYNAMMRVTRDADDLVKEELRL